MSLTKIGTCVLCGKRDVKLIYTSRIINGQYRGDYVCEKCREAIKQGKATEEGNHE